MKKSYSKPTITVGAIQLDQPVAAGCTADRDDMKSLIELGYFADINCSVQAKDDGFDTICYHSNVQVAFSS